MVKLIKVIETNLILDNKGVIKDHQNMVVEVDSWNDYCKAFNDYCGKPVKFKSLTNMVGNSIPSKIVLSNLKFDKFHLSCDIWNGMFKTKKLAYLWNN